MPRDTTSLLDAIRRLFPACVTEAQGQDGQLRLAIDFDLLRQELSDHLIEGQPERYQLNWPGKRQALLSANQPIRKTLRPCRKDSVHFATTKNLFIEGFKNAVNLDSEFRLNDDNCENESVDKLYSLFSRTTDKKITNTEN